MNFCHPILFLFCCLLAQPSFAQITVSPWQMHEGKGHQPLSLDGHGSPEAYKLATIPAANNSGWKAADIGSDGEVIFDRVSTVPCLKAVDFTYFQTEVFIPNDVSVNKFNVNFLQADDGARIYIFNSANPRGAYDPKADLRLLQTNPGTVDLRRFVKKGEVNRVVVVQFDDCAVGNHVHGIQIKVNGDVIKTEPVAEAPKLPTYMVMRTYSVHEGKKEKDSYWAAEKGNNLGIASAAQCKSGQANLIRFVTDSRSGKCALIANGGYAIAPGPNGTIERKRVGDEIPGSCYWNVKRCLSSKANAAKYVSFEHPSKPGYFLRHSSYLLRCDKNNGSELFKQDASWKFEKISVEEYSDTDKLPAVCRASSGGTTRGGGVTKTEIARKYTAPYGSSMTAGKRLEMGQELVSSNGSCKMRMQYDGNLAIYRSGKWVWDAKCANRGSYVIMQTDGNFVCYSKSNKAVWSSETHPHFNKRYAQSVNKPVSCTLTNDGNCALKNRSGKTVWTCGRKTGPVEVTSSTGSGKISSRGFDPGKYYRLTTSWQGDGKSLDIINDGSNRTPSLKKSGNYTGQAWKLTPAGNGYYRLSTRWQGVDKPLDIVSGDGKENRPILATAQNDNWAGQFWKVTPLGNGFYRLTTKWKGENMSLDIINDGKNNTPVLSKSGNYSGQKWKIVEFK